MLGQGEFLYRGSVRPPIMKVYGWKKGEKGIKQAEKGEGTS